MVKEVRIHARHLYGADARGSIRLVLRLYRMVRPGRRRRRRQEMIVISIFTLLVFIYLIYALVNPDKF
ncbi:potassium-transporting ATPase subunit F [Cohnella sp. AR92]|nr:potassium-transporting ATPase subunit F [Cohnella sp. AR92]